MTSTHNPRMTAVGFGALLLGALAVALLLTGAGCGIAVGAAGPGVGDGQRIYRAECASCHGDKGDRIPAAPLGAAEFLDSRGDATLMAVIAEGKGVMPAFGKERGGPLTEDHVRSVLAHLSVAAGRTSSSLTAEEGRKVFQESCGRCHGEKGDRIPAAPLNAKGFLDTRTDADLVRTIADGKGLMPAWSKDRGGSLSDNQIRAAVAFLRYSVDASVAQRARQGREFYVGNCLVCHGERGDRVPGIPLAAADYLTKLGDGSLISSVNDGKGVMPGFGRAKGGPFGIPETAALLTYLKTWAGLRATAALTGPEQVGTGRDLFMRNCTPCHGEGGDQVAGVQLRSPAFLSNRTDRVVRQTIAQGNDKGMPAWSRSNGGPFTEEQLDAVVRYLASSAGPGALVSASAPAPAAAGAAPAAAPALASGGAGAALASKGQQVYTQNCLMCHGEKRDQIPTCKLADADWLKQKGDDWLVNAIAKGKPGTIMLAWEGKIPPDDIKAIVGYLKDAAGGGGVQAGAAATSGGANGAPAGVAATSGGASGAAATGAAANGAQASASTGAGGGAPAGSGAPAESLTAGEARPSSAQGKQLYTQNCVMCHGANGMQQPNCKLGSREWLMSTSEDGLKSRIANGKPAGGMPAWGKAKGGPLSDNQITAIIMYLFEGIQP